MDINSSVLPSPLVPGVSTATAVPLPLSFDDESDAPIPFVLTAAAQRGVLGREIPPLSVVPAAVEPADTRRVQARALLRSGMPVPTIAAALDVDAVTVEGWTADLIDELARRRRRTVHRARGARISPGIDAGGTDGEPVSVTERDRMLPGLAFAVAATDGDAVTLLHDRLSPVAVLVDALIDQVPDLRGRMRVALRVGGGLPQDRVRAEVADRLGIDAHRIIVGRGGEDLMSSGRLEIRIDIRDEVAAQLVRSWRAGSSGDASGLRGWDSNPQTFRLTADCSAS
jgi:hypothetical protein